MNHGEAEILEVFQTTDYGKFVFTNENRVISPRHIARLMESIQEHGYLKERPIEVLIDGAKMVVLDGQHRLIACRSLDEPVHYIVKSGTIKQAATDIRVINAYSRAWRDKDYLRHFIGIGAEPYIKLNEFMEAQDLPITSAIQLLAAGGEFILKRQELVHSFRAGVLVFDEDSAERADKIMKPVNEIRNFNDRLDTMRRQTAFVNALIILTSDSSYEHDRMMRNLAQNISSIIYCTSVGKYLQVLEDIYNYRRKDGTRISLSARGIAFIRPPEEAAGHQQ